jgi:hypothetical protein
MGEKILDPDGDLSDAEIYRLQSQSLIGSAALCKTPAEKTECLRLAAELFDLAVASDAPVASPSETTPGRERGGEGNYP